MTIFGWDASHYDGPLSLDTLKRARAEGITFFTHKAFEGLQDTEGSMDDTALAAARDAGIPFLGAYFVPRSNATPAAQVAAWMRALDAGEPWWRDFPGFFAQVDLEKWPYDSVSPAIGIECAKRLRDAMDRCAILYASHGQYMDTLTAWDGPLWNADYVSSGNYPGDDWQPLHGSWRGGWAPYSGKTPAILQYTSSKTIAGLTTCDANAYRGSVADFAAMIGGVSTMDLDYTNTQTYPVPDDGGRSAKLMGFETWVTVHEGRSAYGDGAGVWLVETLNATTAALAAQAAKLDAMSAAITALASGGTSIDTAAVLAAVKGVGDVESAAVATLQAQVAGLRAALAKATSDAAGALAQES